MSTASVNLFGCGNSPTIPLFRIAPKSLRSPFTAISGDKKPNFAKGVQLRWPIKASSTNDLRGVYATRQLELTVKNVDLVLEDVRPYLIADSGNVDVVSVEDGIICLELQGHFSEEGSGSR
uniref:NIF system FeS cluster assembly NifU C-terminal domain-containing protein n=1 Tax=Opuntia streptacantha TaxID=393608 RepID=A0A7C9DGS3_OPUST